METQGNADVSRDSDRPDLAGEGVFAPTPTGALELVVPSHEVCMINLVSMGDGGECSVHSIHNQ